MTRGRRIFAVVGFGLAGLMVLGFLLEVLWQVKSGHGGDKYHNVKHQPLTYVGTLISFGIVTLIGIVALYYRAKRALERRRSRSVQEQKRAA